MRPQIPVPSKGLPLRATWGAQVADRVNELCAMAPAGMLAREGFGGIGAQPLPKNMRDVRSRPKLWSFFSSESEGSGGKAVRSGGWFNCRLQVGYTKFLGDDQITGRDLCEDGVYYVEVNLKDETAEIKKAADGEDVPPIDIVNSLVRIPIGTVDDGVLTGAPLDLVPVVYKYV